MALNPEEKAKFESGLKEILAQYGYELVVVPFFIDALGHKHPIKVGGEFGAELQVIESKKDGPDTRN